VVGFLVLAGWLFNLAALKSLLPGLVAMNPLTALTFMAAGTSLWLIETRPHQRFARRARVLFAAGVSAVGLLKLGGILTGRDPGLDQILFHDKLAGVGTSLPNRMAPNTALAFLLLGLALLALYGETRIDLRVSQALALGATIISSLAVIGYIYGVSSLTGVSSYIHMALNTAVAFVVLSLGVLCARARLGIMAVLTSDGPGGALARAQLPVAILTPIVFGWLRLKGQELRLYNTDAGVSLTAVYSMYLSATLIWVGARSLDRLDVARRAAERERLQSKGEREARAEQAEVDGQLQVK
jgi:hypothetical protein